MPRPSRRRQRGQVLVMFALSMVFMIAGMISVAVDLSQLYEARVRFYDAAEQAAISAASDVVVCPQQQGQCSDTANEGAAPQLDPGAYSLCETTGDDFSGVAGSTTCIAVGADTIEARVSAPVALVIPIFTMGSYSVTATYEAAPVLGGQAPVA